MIDSPYNHKVMQTNQEPGFHIILAALQGYPDEIRSGMPDFDNQSGCSNQGHLSVIGRLGWMTQTHISGQECRNGSLYVNSSAALDSVAFQPWAFEEDKRPWSNRDNRAFL